ncbi:iron-sulfur cluster repair di-iron protein [Virgibacillus necropolis]|uniref:iron-sulfur cluster repair di-iron protein n=1 Tax=Virgibacillus necropolis TaxID=163877 RepID=UPI00384B61D6
MEQLFTEQSKTGDIVVKFPMASQVLKRYKIDFCCGGDRPIGEAIDKKQLDKEYILKEINELYNSTIAMQEKQIDWTEKSYNELIDYVVNKHHAYLNQVLPELSGFVTKVYRVHSKNHPELSQVFSKFHQLKTELELHLIREEEMIFPKIKAYEQEKKKTVLAEVVESINMLESEHEHSGNLLSEIREVTNDYKLPDGACKTYHLTYLKLQELESDIFNHVHLENNIMFPRLIEENAS